MKAIQVVFDEDLLEELDSRPEVRERGRSAVLREAAAAYLKRRRESEIAEQYARAYGAESGLGADLEGWEEEGVWPDE